MGRRTRVEQDDLGPVLPRPRPARRGGVAPPTRRSVSAVFLIFLVVALAGASALAVFLHNQRAQSSAPPPQPQRVVIFLVDGATSFPATLMPDVSRLARAGTSYDRAWIGQWPAVRPASAATVGSGVFPAKHGIIGDSWRDPGTGREVRPTLPSAVRLGSIDQVLESRGLTPIAALVKDRDPASKVLAVGGVGCAPANAAGSWLADYVLCIARVGDRWVERAVTGHNLPAGAPRTASVPVASGKGLGPRLEGWQLGGQDDQIAQNAIAAMRATNPALTLVEFPEPAAIGAFAPAHRRSAVLGTLLAGVDHDIKQIETALRADRRLARTAFVVTSGEALSPLRHTLPASAFSDAVIAAGGVPVFVHGGAAASISLQDLQGAQSVAQAIEASQLSGIDAIFYRTKRAGAWQYEPQYLDPLLRPAYGDALSALVGTAAANNAPDVVAVYAPHLGTPPSAGGLRALSVSGGFGWDTQHVPLILSGAGVVSAQVSHFPARLVDLAPTVEALLRLSPASGDGVVLADALTSAPNGASDQQQRRQAALKTIVDALIARLNAAG